MTQGEYVFDNAWKRARERLRHVERNHDPATIERLEEIGVRPGQVCLELGAGGGSITEWLCKRVGDRGRVVAIDLDTRFVGALDFEHLEVREADIVEHDLERDAYDLVVTRLTLMHIPERVQVLAKLVGALRPGGWIYVRELEPSGTGPVGPVPEDLVRLNTLERQARMKASTQRGLAPDFARKVAAHLVNLGLSDVRAEIWSRLLRGGTEDGELFQLNNEQMRDQMLATGVITAEEFDKIQGMWRDPRFLTWPGLAVETWGRKPAGDGSGS